MAGSEVNTLIFQQVFYITFMPFDNIVNIFRLLNALLRAKMKMTRAGFALKRVKEKNNYGYLFMHFSLLYKDGRELLL